MNRGGGLRFNIPPEERAALEAEAHLAGYRFSEYLRTLLRLGRAEAHRGAIRRSAGLHFVEPGVDGRATRRDGVARRDGALPPPPPVGGGTRRRGGSGGGRARRRAPGGP
jgi:hypothetical protein